MRDVGWFVLSTGLFVCGCEPDPKAASNRNFRRVISAELKKEPQYLTWQPQSGAPVPILGQEEPRYPILDEFLKMGALKRGSGFLQPYQVTAAGAGLVSWERMFGNILINIGVADAQSVEVARFSEPTRFGPMTVAEVEYTHKWKPSRLLTEERYAAIAALLSDHVGKLGQTSRDKMVLALYSDGWRAAD